MLVHAEREAARRAHGLEAARVVRGLAREAREAAHAQHRRVHPSPSVVRRQHRGARQCPHGPRAGADTAGGLSRDGQRQLVAEATQIVARIAGDPSQASRTWVLLTEAAEGGWGIAGTAFGREEFAALAAKKK